MKNILVLGGSFAGMTAAIEIKQHLKDMAQVTVIDKRDEFIFNPSLIWVPFGLRDKKDISFKLDPVFTKKNITFKQAIIASIDLKYQTVTTDDNQLFPYDYLVIATGAKLNYASIPGLDPADGYCQSIFTYDDAVKAGDEFDKFVANRGGEVVIGAVQGASCFGAAYEFLFNMVYQLKKHKLDKVSPVTFVTAEPYLAHLGLGGFGMATQMCNFMFKQSHIKLECDSEFKKITQNKIELTDGRIIPFKYAMLTPSYLGVDPVRALTDITDSAGFVKINDYYQANGYTNVFACGVAISLPASQPTKVPCAVPKTGYLSEEMAKVVAHNVVASVKGEKLTAKNPGEIDAKCIMDAGNNGIIMTADHFLEPRAHAWLIPGPEAHFAKLAFEKYFLTTHKMGIV